MRTLNETFHEFNTNTVFQDLEESTKW
jgi:hypothetical protein